MRWLAIPILFAALGLQAAERGEVDLAVYTGADFLDQSQFELSVMSVHGLQVADRFQDGRAVLNYGLYKLEIKLTGFNRYERSFMVDQPHTDVLARLKLGDVANYHGATAPTRIIGTLRNSPVPYDELWVRAEPVHEGQDSAIADSRVGTDGSFSMAVGYSSASYRILVLWIEPDQQHPGLSGLRPIHGTTVVGVFPHSESTVEIDLRGTVDAPGSDAPAY